MEEDTLDDDALALAHLDLRDVWMADLLGAQRIDLNGCCIHRLDVRGADLGKIRFANTEIFELLVDPFVKFGTSVPSVHSIIVYKDFKESRLPGSPADWIARRSSRSLRNDPEPDERWHLLEKFARISMRQYSIRSVEDQMDPAAKRVIASPHWPDLRVLLEKHGRLEVSTAAPASGPKSEWFHLVAGAEFLNPEGAGQDSTRKILDELNVKLPGCVSSARDESHA